MSKDEIAKHAITVFFGRVFIRLAQFASFLILVRVMPPSEFGWFGVLTTAIALAATVGSLGLRQSIAFEVGQKRLGIGEAIGTSVAVWIPLALISGGVVYAIYGRVLPNCSTGQAAGIIFLGVGATILIMLLQGLYLGSGAINAFTWSESLPRLALLLSAAVLALTGSLNLCTALWVNVGSFAITIPIAVWMAWKSGVDKMALRLGRFIRMIPYGMIFALNMLLNTLCLRISVFFIQRSEGAAAAGQFFAAVRIYEIVLEFATAFGLVLFSNAARQPEAHAVVRRNARIACWILWLFAGATALVWVVAPLAVTLMGGMQYADAGPILQILGLSLAPAAASKVIYPAIAGMGRPGFGTPVIAASLAVNVGLALVLVPRIGSNGGAIALVIGQFVLFMGYLLACRLSFGIPFREFLVPHWGYAKLVMRTIASFTRSRRVR